MLRILTCSLLALSMLPCYALEVSATAIDEQIVGKLERGQNNLSSPAKRKIIRVIPSDGSGPLTERVVQIRMSDVPKANFFYTQTWARQKLGIFTASAPGIDLKHHIVNGYLVGFAPYQTKNVWEPLLALALFKKYQIDSRTYFGRGDVWQTSKQAFGVSKGDCEDHAVALADWLIQMGEDARVVVGEYKGGGHAWVILFKDGHEFLLEATSKNRVRSARALPIASTISGYVPEFMFNRDRFWYNTAGSFITSYSSDKWLIRSDYKG